MLFILIDAHSNWPEVMKKGMNEKTDTDKVIEVLENLFARYGICEEIVSDNGL